MANTNFPVTVDIKCTMDFNILKHLLSVRCEKTRSYGARTATVRCLSVLNDPSKHRMSAVQI